MATASEEKIAAAFHRFDIDGSGDIDVRELQPALAQLGMEADSIQAQAVLRKYDANLNGKLDLEEFGRMVQELIAFQKNQQVAPSSEPAAPGAPAPKPAAQQPQAKGPPAARDVVAQQLQQPDVRSLLSQHRGALDEMFTFYARLERTAGSAAGAPPALELKELLHLLQDFQLTPGPIPREEVRAAHKQSEADDEPELRDALSLAEFDACLLRRAPPP